MRWLVLVLLVLVSATGCKKKSAPEVYRLESDVEVLVAREGDDAWERPELEAIEQQLAAIPADVVEAARVQALLQRVRSERARVKAERAARTEKVPEPPPPPPRDDQGGMAVPPALPEEEDDAGVEVLEPTLGMPEAEFVARFGKCFKPGPMVDVPDAGRGTSQVVLNQPECEARFGEKGSTVSHVFIDGKLRGRLTEGPPTRQVVDAGPPPPKPPPPPPPPTPFDASVLFVIPGAPRPENMVPAPGSPGSELP
jgi:hypothetical protein